MSGRTAEISRMEHPADCAIENQQGFSEEEVEQLEVYLMEHADELMEKAKEMSKLTNLL